MRASSRLILSVAAMAVGAAANATAGEAKAGGRSFRVPDGFVVERVAGPPLVDRPIVADFDEAGRLYVADSSGSNDSPAKQLEAPSHRIVRLEDADGDGVYERGVVFADRMMFPEGAMWRAGSLYVAAPPSIWKLTDTDGDGKADLREEWFRGKTLTGCANDLHGPYDGPDGWIYWCKGAFAEQTYERPGGKPPLKTRAAHVFRARPDGTGVEPVMAGGMDNPVELAFTPGGERIFTTTFLQHPGGGHRDGLIHAVYGGLYGKDHDVLDGHPRTGPDLMPVLTHLGPAAPSGLMRYESPAFGPDFKDNLFAALFNLHKVTRQVLEPSGATFRTRDADFLAAADDLDFHPTDVLEDADGSLLVLDTGGWYKLCCPTSQIGKPDILGAIYRVRRAGAAKVGDPRGLLLKWDGVGAVELAERLDDPRPAVRRRAVAALAALGAKALPTLSGTVRLAATAEGRVAAVWACARIDHPEARVAVRLALRSPDEAVRQAAAHAAGLWRDRDTIAPLMALLGGPSPQNARAAAEALGRIGEPLIVEEVLRAAGRAGSDRVLEHSILYAVIEIASAERTARGLASDDPSVRRAAMIALDQMGGAVPPEALKAALAEGGRGGEAAAWIFELHPEHGAVLADFLRGALDAPDTPPNALERLGTIFARCSGSAPVRDLLGERLAAPGARREVRLMLMRAASRARAKGMPASWSDGLAASIRSGDPEVAGLAVATARAMAPSGVPAGALADALRAVAGDLQAPDAVRLEALAAIPTGAGNVAAETFAFLLDQASPDRPAPGRLLAADALGRLATDPKRRAAVAETLKEAGPLEASRLLAAFDGATEEETGRRLVAALKASPALPSLQVEALRPRLAKFPEPVRREAEALYAAIERGAAERRSKLDSLLGSLPAGDLRRGQAVFHGTKAACASCHAIGYLGGTFGPDLSRIGAIRSDRDMIESVVEPSASFVRSYEPTIVATKSGQVHSGVLRRDAADEVVLAVAADKDVGIPRAEVEEMRPGTVSVMPAGLDAQLSRQELADLLAFLRSRR